MNLLENRRMDAEIAEKVFGFDAGDYALHYSTEIEPASQIIERLRKAGIEVVIGCFAEGFSTEIRTQFIDTAEFRGHRVIFRSSGAISLPAALAQAVLRPETLTALAEADSQ